MPRKPYVRKTNKVYKKKTGNPTKYKPEYCQKLIDHMAKGFSFATFGAVINSSDSTIYEWVDKHPEFADAKRAAFKANLLFWEKKGQEGLWNVKDEKGRSKSFNSKVWIVNMRNRFNWCKENNDGDNSKQSLTLNYVVNKDD